MIRLETLVRMTSLLEDSGSGACYKSHGMKIKCVSALYREVILAVTSVKSKSCVEYFNFEIKVTSLLQCTAKRMNTYLIFITENSGLR